MTVWPSWPLPLLHPCLSPDPGQGWVRTSGCHCSRSSWFEDHQFSHLIPKFSRTHLDIWQKKLALSFPPIHPPSRPRACQTLGLLPIVHTCVYHHMCIWVYMCKLFFFQSLPDSSLFSSFFFSPRVCQTPGPSNSRRTALSWWHATLHSGKKHQASEGVCGAKPHDFFYYYYFFL